MKYILIFLGSLFISDYAISANSMHDQSESKHHYTPTIKKDIQDKASSSLSEPNISLRTKSMGIQELRKSLINSKPFIAPAKYNIIKNILDTCENNGSSENLQYLNIRIPTPKANETSLQSSKLKKNKKIRDKRKAKKSSSLPNNNTSLISSINSIPLISSIEKPGALASTEEPKSILEGPTSRPKAAAKKSSSLLSDSSLTILESAPLASEEEINSVVEKFKKIFNNITQDSSYNITLNENLNVINDKDVFKIIAKFKDLIKDNRKYNSLLKINNELETEFKIKDKNLQGTINNIRHTFLEKRRNEGWNIFKRDLAIESEVLNIQDFQEWNFNISPDQNSIEALLGYLFFPIELERDYEFPELYYDKPKIRLTIAFSARYKYPFALYHLYKIFYKYGDIGSASHQNSIISLHKEIQSIIKNNHNPNFENYFLKYLFEGIPNQINQPLYKDPRWLFLEYYVKDNKEYGTQYLENAIKKGYDKAKLLQIQYDNQKNFTSKIKAYITLGNEGTPEGFYRAALLIDRVLPELIKAHKEETNYFEEKDPWPYFKKAALLGISQAYEEIVQLLEKTQSNSPTPEGLIELKEWYKKYGDHWDPKGYFELAELYEAETIIKPKTEEDKFIDIAKEFYIKAGPKGGYENAIDLCRHTDDQNKLQDKLNNFWVEHINRLISIHSDSNLTPLTPLKVQNKDNEIEIEIEY